MQAATVRSIGTVGLVVTVLLIAVNLAHPVGDTETYGDAVKFIGKMNTFWIILHLIIAATVLMVPFVVRAWVDSLETDRARAWGHFGWMLVLGGTVIGAIHLAGIDGVALPAFGKVLKAGRGLPELVAAAAALLKVHLTTFVSWTLVMWMGAQLVVGVAGLLDSGQPRWLSLVALVGAGFAVASVLVTTLEGQLTTLSEGGLFRPSTVAFTIWFLVVSWRLRKVQTVVSA